MKTLSANQLRAHRVPPGSLTLWWLGQAGFVVKSPAGRLVVIDPYLSNSAKAIGDQHGLNLDRLVPPPLAPLELAGVDLYAMTHSHGDHLDPETLVGYRAAGGRGPFLAPAETAEKLQQLDVPAGQIVMTWPNKICTVGDLEIRATFAIPFSGDDLTHVGYLVRVVGGCCVYFTGDTAYHELLAISVGPHKPDVLVAVINPAFRNMGPIEAARLARELNVQVAIPCHYDMFPDNSLPPQLLRTNLVVEGIGDRYRRLEHGKAFTFPETMQ
ncbi:MAG: MBL fold metallo-hydrolase [Pirellulaceae bacterium]|nr:MBL fold metallo-hydrolase [Pirellulaceae bacterium]